MSSRCSIDTNCALRVQSYSLRHLLVLAPLCHSLQHKEEILPLALPLSKANICWYCSSLSSSPSIPLASPKLPLTPSGKLSSSALHFPSRPSLMKGNSFKVPWELRLPEFLLLHSLLSKRKENRERKEVSAQLSCHRPPTLSLERSCPLPDSTPSWAKTQRLH